MHHILTVMWLHDRITLSVLLLIAPNKHQHNKTAFNMRCQLNKLVGLKLWYNNQPAVAQYEYNQPAVAQYEYNQPAVVQPNWYME